MKPSDKVEWKSSGSSIQAYNFVTRVEKPKPSVVEKQSSRGLEVPYEMTQELFETVLEQWVLISHAENDLRSDQLEHRKEQLRQALYRHSQVSFRSPGGFPNVICTSICFEMLRELFTGASSISNPVLSLIFDGLLNSVYSDYRPEVAYVENMPYSEITREVENHPDELALFRGLGKVEKDLMVAITRESVTADQLCQLCQDHTPASDQLAFLTSTLAVQPRDHVRQVFCDLIEHHVRQEELVKWVVEDPRLYDQLDRALDQVNDLDMENRSRLKKHSISTSHSRKSSISMTSRSRKHQSTQRIPVLSQSPSRRALDAQPRKSRSSLAIFRASAVKIKNQTKILSLLRPAKAGEEKEGLLSSSSSGQMTLQPHPPQAAAGQRRKTKASLRKGSLLSPSPSASLVRLAQHHTSSTILLPAVSSSAQEACMMTLDQIQTLLRVVSHHNDESSVLVKTQEHLNRALEQLRQMNSQHPDHYAQNQNNDLSIDEQPREDEEAPEESEERSSEEEEDEDQSRRKNSHDDDPWSEENFIPTVATKFAERPESMAYLIKYSPDLFAQTIQAHPGILKYYMIKERETVKAFLELDDAAKQRFEILAKEHGRGYQLLFVHKDDGHSHSHSMEKTHDDDHYAIQHWLTRNLADLAKYILDANSSATICQLFDAMMEYDTILTRVMIMDMWPHACFDFFRTLAMSQMLEQKLALDPGPLCQALADIQRGDSTVLNDYLKTCPHLQVFLTGLHKNQVRNMIAQDVAGWKSFIVSQLLVQNDFLLRDSVYTWARIDPSRNILVQALESILSGIGRQIMLSPEDEQSSQEEEEENTAMDTGSDEDQEDHSIIDKEQGSNEITEIPSSKTPSTSDNGSSSTSGYHPRSAAIMKGWCQRFHQKQQELTLTTPPQWTVIHGRRHFRHVIFEIFVNRIEYEQSSIMTEDRDETRERMIYWTCDYILRKYGGNEHIFDQALGEIVWCLHKYKTTDPIVYYIHSMCSQMEQPTRRSLIFFTASLSYLLLGPFHLLLPTEQQQISKENESNHGQAYAQQVFLLPEDGRAVVPLMIVLDVSVQIFPESSKHRMQLVLISVPSHLDARLRGEIYVYLDDVIVEWMNIWTEGEGRLDEEYAQAFIRAACGGGDSDSKKKNNDLEDLDSLNQNNKLVEPSRFQSIVAQITDIELSVEDVQSMMILGTLSSSSNMMTLCQMLACTKTFGLRKQIPRLGQSHSLLSRLEQKRLATRVLGRNPFLHPTLPLSLEDELRSFRVVWSKVRPLNVEKDEPPQVLEIVLAIEDSLPLEEEGSDEDQLLTSEGMMHLWTLFRSFTRLRQTLVTMDGYQKSIACIHRMVKRYLWRKSLER